MKLIDEMVDFARESVGLKPDAAVEIYPFSGRGSDRAYFRLRWDQDKSAILVLYQPDRLENTYFAGIAAFLVENAIPVPEIIRHDSTRCLILMKDLGDTDLWSLRDSAWEKRKVLYQKTLTIAHKLHAYPENLFPSERVKLMDAFGTGLYRWERGYFLENFVTGLCGIEIEPEFAEELELELAELAKRISAVRRSLVHRDLQSQNVMIYEDKPHLIDFQGMRFGTRFYDLGSLLCDPYVGISESERKELLSFYYDLSLPEADWDRFQIMFWEASSQRLMQALGAFGWLGIQRGLRDYLAYVPAGLRNLRLAIENANSLPKLLEVCTWCEEASANAKLGIQNRDL